MIKSKGNITSFQCKLALECTEWSVQFALFNIHKLYNLRRTVSNMQCSVCSVLCEFWCVHWAANKCAPVCIDAKKTEHAAKAWTFSAVENPAQQIWVSTSFETDLRFESAYLHFSDCFEQLASKACSVLPTSNIGPLQLINRVKRNIFKRGFIFYFASSEIMPSRMCSHIGCIY